METLYNARYQIGGWGTKIHNTDPEKISLKLRCDNTGTRIEITDLIISQPYRDRLNKAFKDKEHIQIWITTDFVKECPHNHTITVTPLEGNATNATCTDCGTVLENWKGDARFE